MSAKLKKITEVVNSHCKYYGKEDKISQNAVPWMEQHAKH